jgi:hypothetical protein
MIAMNVPAAPVVNSEVLVNMSRNPARAFPLLLGKFAHRLESTSLTIALQRHDPVPAA